MTHPIYRVAHFDIVGPYTLLVTFNDGTEQRVDFRPVLKGAVLGPLRDLSTFNTVTLDSEVGTLTWPNGADFDPATLHDWPSICDELTARAREWIEIARPGQQRANQRMEPTRR
jgi:hypothetical protein